MSKEIMSLEFEKSVERNINNVTKEICFIKAQTQCIVLQSAIEIGKRLIEAKALVPYGEWGKYLKEQVDFSQSTANNMMKLAEEYGSEQLTIFSPVTDSQAIANLPYTKALRLLALPSDEREEFIEQNDVEALSTREIEKLIRERDDARRQLQDTAGKLDSTQRELSNSRANVTELREKLTQAQNDVKAADDEAVENERALKEEIENLKADLEKKKAAEKKAKDKLKELQDNPEIPKEVLDRMKAEAEQAARDGSKEEIERIKADALKEKAEAEQALKAAQGEVKTAAQRLEALEKQVRAASPEVTEFKLYFERVQEDWNRMQGALLKVRGCNPETADKLQSAVSAVLEQWKG